MLRKLLVSAGLALALSGSAGAQEDETLADIRSELSALYTDLQSLRQELTASGQGTQGVAGATPLDRLNAIEAELTRLTAKTEQLEFRIDRVVSDGTNRVGDLEFRLCELEPGCDIGNLGSTPTLGGDAAAPVGPAPAEPSAGPALAVAEREDYERAQAAMNEGDFQTAADLLASFSETYPGSPVAAQVHLLRGQAHEQLGETTNAARGYLESFSAAPEGPVAPEALTRLGTTLGALGQQQDACITLGEVSVRFPDSDQVDVARQAMQTLGCS
ncbi:tol-pal system protein YbgF [Salibaculum griseiflavum]|jgi:tol-pal system protein YbgF|uniref:Cell division coordinator CpoB n=1 Tax=Salibaculum griseiflavum TaxID=1914409 RepID=A0A2V1P7V5_9RHOB|nr:tol-pal system protein YbgF [Salibaculum griseiflavum]PWG17888.1 tol-pal system protein YbgF [Salibaculum griseiflavum]